MSPIMLLDKRKGENRTSLDSPSLSLSRFLLLRALTNGKVFNALAPYAQTNLSVNFSITNGKVLAVFTTRPFFNNVILKGAANNFNFFFSAVNSVKTRLSFSQRTTVVTTTRLPTLASGWLKWRQRPSWRRRSRGRPH